MKIIVTDAKTLALPESEWRALRELGTCAIYDRTTPDELLDRARDAEILLTNKVVVDRESMRRMNHLRYIGVLATGYNVVDTQAAKELGITVTNIPAYGTDSVAQAVFALILELAWHTGEHSADVHGGGWSRSADFCYWKEPLISLTGKTIGILGYGRIGRRVAEIAKAFGMKVLVHRHGGGAVAEGAESVSLEELFRQSDFLTLHLPLTPETADLIGPKTLAWMKPSAYLINTGRGGLVDEPALAEALAGTKIAGAALDVLKEEPPVHGSPLIGLKNCIITPHIAWAAENARKKLFEIAVENIRMFQKGTPQNIIVKGERS